MTFIYLCKRTDPGGRIVKKDIIRAMEEVNKVKKLESSGEKIKEAKPVSGEQILPRSFMRQAIARRMIQSIQTVPHLYLSVDVDARELVRLREKLLTSVEKAVGIRLTYTDLLLKIVARAVECYPEINVIWTDAGIKKLSEINIGVAVAVKEGVMIPVIRQVNLKPVAEIAYTRFDISKRAREGRIVLSEVRGGSLTLTNLGMFGVDRFQAIIHPPKSCGLAVGRIADRPAVVKGELTIRPQMDLTLAVDHRVLDGVSGARFLQKVKELIEQPSLMVFY